MNILTSSGRCRSDRIMLTIRLRVPGNDARGKRFKEDARTITVNRHGARIRTRAVLRVDQVVRLVNPVGQSDADFRSEKTYCVGQGISVACPYDTAGENIEVPARIARARQVAGTQRNIYGVRYEPQGPEDSRRPLRS